jgi:hypothetical protein
VDAELVIEPICEDREELRKFLRKGENLMFIEGKPDSMTYKPSVALIQRDQVECIFEHYLQYLCLC